MVDPATGSLPDVRRRNVNGMLQENVTGCLARVEVGVTWTRMTGGSIPMLGFDLRICESEMCLDTDSTRAVA